MNVVAGVDEDLDGRVGDVIYLNGQHPGGGRRAGSGCVGSYYAGLAFVGNGAGECEVFRKLDAALEPLLGHAQPSYNPKQAWGFVHDQLHPSRMTRPEARLIERLLSDQDEQRHQVFGHIESTLGAGPETMAISEMEIMASMEESTGELARRARLARAYEALCSQPNRRIHYPRPRKRTEPVVELVQPGR